jgi:hypothetical protein
VFFRADVQGFLSYEQIACWPRVVLAVGPSVRRISPTVEWPMRTIAC